MFCLIPCVKRLKNLFLHITILKGENSNTHEIYTLINSVNQSFLKVRRIKNELTLLLFFVTVIVTTKFFVIGMLITNYLINQVSFVNILFLVSSLILLFLIFQKHKCIYNCSSKLCKQFFKQQNQKKNLFFPQFFFF